MSRLSHGVALIGCLLAPPADCPADNDQESQQRLQMMEREIAQYSIDPPPGADPRAFRFAAKPLLRYSDLTRGTSAANVLIDATVWRLGEQGRPTALITLEIYRARGANGILSLECLSLSPDQFSLRHKEFDIIAWDADESALSLKPLPDGPAPAETAAARLLQLRHLARRFAVQETLESGESMSCRMLPQPIDRYQAPDKQIVDGAIFAFANGTNPEVGVVLECDGAQWSYGPVRLSSAEMTVTLDEAEVAAFPAVASVDQPRGSYVARLRPVELPE